MNHPIKNGNLRTFNVNISLISRQRIDLMRIVDTEEFRCFVNYGHITRLAINENDKNRRGFSFRKTDFR